MSTNLPPGSPGGPEYLDSASGSPLQEPAASGSRRPRAAWIAGGLVGVLALGGAGAWAAWSFFSTGAQPAEALPASTIAYASVDLDPSGGQKIEALRTLQKFPAFEDRIGLDTDDDVRQRIFEEIQRTGACEDLDYADDIEPWLGDRMAVAAVDAGGDSPEAVFVLQVSDEDAADEGLGKIRECSGGHGGAWAIDGGWALVGETQEAVDDIAADAADAPLADDEDYASWTDEAGGAGIATVYVAPEAGEVLAEENGGLPERFGTGDLTAPDPVFGMPYAGALEEFEGMAATLRFDDGALELEVAADAGASQDSLSGSDAGDDVLATLPEDTAVAIGVGFAEGWFGDLVDQMASSFGTGMSAEELLDELSAESGLDLPEDVETLTGESAALAVGSDFDPESFFNSTDGSGLPVGLKVHGDPDAIESVLDKLRPQLGPQNPFLASDTGDGLIAVGPDADYREQLLEDGDLGGSDVFDRAVREADDAAAIVFVNFDAASDLVAEATGDAPDVSENLEPLQGLGISGWLEDDTSHLVLRITTD